MASMVLSPLLVHLLQKTMNIGSHSQIAELRELSCQPCASDDPICAKWGSQVISRSLAYGGSGTNLQPFLQKILSGGECLAVTDGMNQTGQTP